MTLNITLDLPADLVERLCRESSNLNVDVKEAYAMELFRQKKLSHFELSRVLGLDRFETDAFLKRHRVFENSLTMADLDSDAETLRRVANKVR